MNTFWHRKLVTLVSLMVDYNTDVPLYKLNLKNNKIKTDQKTVFES